MNWWPDQVGSMLRESGLSWGDIENFGKEFRSALYTGEIIEGFRFGVRG